MNLRLDFIELFLIANAVSLFTVLLIYFVYNMTKKMIFKLQTSHDKR